MNNKFYYLKSFLLLFILTLFISCSDDDNNESEAEAYTRNQQELEAYIEANDLNVEKSNSGLYYVITTEGEGATPTTSSDVTVTYKGYFLDGTVFDQATTEVEFNLGQVIPGFREGISYMQEGGSATLLMPARLAYGSRGSGSIPPNTAIAFDIELIATE